MKKRVWHDPVINDAKNEKTLSKTGVLDFFDWVGRAGNSIPMLALQQRRR